MNTAAKILLRQEEIAGIIESTSWKTNQRDTGGKSFKDIGTAVRSSHVFYITREITDLLRGHSLEAAITSDELPFHKGLLLLEGGYANEAYLWCCCSEQPHWVFYGHRNAKLQCGDLALDDPSCIEAISLTKFMLSKKAATFQTVPLGDGTYKTQIRLNRVGPDRNGPHIIILRSLVREYRRTETYKAVDWKSRWWVRGHFRRVSPGKIVTVKPYIKGPLYRPLVSTVYDVVH